MVIMVNRIGMASKHKNKRIIDSCNYGFETDIETKIKKRRYPNSYHKVNQPDFYDYIIFKDKKYYGTIKDGIAILYDNPFDSSIPKIRVKIKKTKFDTIKDKGDTEVLIIDGKIIK